MSAALSTSQAAVVRSTSTGGSVTAEASPRVAAFFLELVLDEPAQDAVLLPDVVRFLDVMQFLDVVQFLDAEQFLDVVRALDVVRVLDVELSLDAACSPCGVLSLVGTQPVDEAQARALLELRPVSLDAVQVWLVG